MVIVSSSSSSSCRNTLAQKALPFISTAQTEAELTQAVEVIPWGKEVVKVHPGSSGEWYNRRIQVVFDPQLIQRGIVPWWTQALFWACFRLSFSRPYFCLPKFSVPSFVKFSVSKTALFKTIRVSIRQCQVPIIISHTILLISARKTSHKLTWQQRPESSCPYGCSLLAAWPLWASARSYHMFRLYCVKLL